MKTWSQNLRECSCGKTIGSKLFHGRARYYGKHEWKAEWYFGKFANSCAANLEFQDGGDGLMLHIGIPWLFNIFLGVAGVCRVKKSCRVGFAIHNNSVWFYTFSYTNECNSKDQWWRKGKSWDFPWTYNHHLTEILDAEHRQPVDQPFLCPVVYKEGKGSGKLKRDAFKQMAERQEFEKSVSFRHPYVYHRKNGDIQRTTATVHVDRMTWRMKWWPLLPFKKVRTSISVKFDDELGEGTGSWKGGVLGTGEEMKRGETPRDTLIRMQSERKFGR